MTKPPTSYFLDNGSLAVAVEDLFDSNGEPHPIAFSEAESLRVFGPSSEAAYLWWSCRMAPHTCGMHTPRTLFEASR